MRVSHFRCAVCQEPVTTTPWGILTGCKHHPVDFPRNATTERAARRLAALALRHCPAGHADRAEIRALSKLFEEL